MANTRLRVVRASPPARVVLLTLEQAALRLKTEPDAVRSLVATGRLPHYRDENDRDADVRISAHDLDHHAGKPTEKPESTSVGPKRGVNPVAGLETAVVFLGRVTLEQRVRLIEAVHDVRIEKASANDHGPAWTILEHAKDATGLLTSLEQAESLLAVLVRDSPSSMLRPDDLKKLRDCEPSLKTLSRVVRGLHQRGATWVPSLFEPHLRSSETMDVAKAVLRTCAELGIRALSGAEMAALMICALFEDATESDPGNPPESDVVERTRRAKRWALTLSRARRSLLHSVD